MPNAIVRVFSAARMLAIEAQAIVGAAVVGDFLTLTRNNGQSVGPFNVRGPKGDTGNVNPLGAWPIGSVYISVDLVNPSGKLGGGTWQVFAAGKTLVGVSTGEVEFNTVEKTGGVKTVTLTAAQSGLPAHSHPISDPSHTHPTYSPDWYAQSGAQPPVIGTTGAQGHQTGGSFTGITVQNNAAANASQSHDNLQPYVTVYMWKRTA